MVEPPQTAGKPADVNESNSQPRKPKKHRHLWPEQWSTKKKRLATGILVAGVVAVLAGLSFWWWQNSHKPKAVVVVKTATVTPAKPTTEPSKLTGLPVDPALNKLPVTGVMIENSPDARPQSGLNQAGIIFEAVAEGGITRFLALFQDTSPDYIGPIRSSRPYYLDWLLPFDAAYAHVGGSPDALAQIKSLNVKDMDQFSNGGSYQRITQRYAPHNVYTSMQALHDLEQAKGFTTSNFTSFPRAEKGQPAAQPNPTAIDLSISSYLYNPHYDYDAASNSYKRSEGGKPQTDEKSGDQLAPKVVIALVMPSAIASDGTHTSYDTIGSGPMFIFQNGGLIQGTWKKDSRTAQFVFLGNDGQPVKLAPGQTWISMVGTSGAVTYK